MAASSISSITSATHAIHPSTALELCTRSLRFSVLEEEESRERGTCVSCGRKVKIFCADCSIVVAGVTLPVVRIPLRIDVLRGKEEKADKSTASALAVLSPDVRIWKLPDFPVVADASRVLLLYPSPTSVAVDTLDVRNYDALIVVDTTWARAGGVLQLADLAGAFVHVHLGTAATGGVAPHTIFWRHQPLGPACVSTVEATYYALRGLDVARAKREREEMMKVTRERAEQGLDATPISDDSSLSSLSPALALASCNGLYDGRYDNLLFLFLAQYHRVQHAYTEGEKAGQTYTGKMRAGYIQGAGAATTQTPGATADRGVYVPSAGAKRVRVKGSWAVRSDALCGAAASLKTKSAESFAKCAPQSGDSHDETAAVAPVAAAEAEQIFWKTVAGMRHAYGQPLHYKSATVARTDISHDTTVSAEGGGGGVEGDEKEE
jgi:hypothetical protein